MSETKTTLDPNPLRRRPMAKQYALILPSMYTSSLRKAGPYILADWPWILCHADPTGYLPAGPRTLARILADEIGGLVAEHQKVLDWLLQPDPKNECPADRGQRLFMVDRGYVVPNVPQYRSLWQSIAKSESDRDWDRKHRPSGWQREKAKRNGPDQSDAR